MACLDFCMLYSGKNSWPLPLFMHEKNWEIFLTYLGIEEELLWELQRAHMIKSESGA